jgi:hypothetical protein
MSIGKSFIDIQISASVYEKVRSDDEQSKMLIISWRLAKNLLLDGAL